MSEPTFGTPAPPVQNYVVAWSEGICRVLSQLTHASFRSSVAYTAPGLSPPAPEEGVWMCFAASQRLTGDQAFGIPASEAPRLAGVLLGGTPAPGGPLSPEQRDALGELFRQCAGSVALELTGKLGGEVELKFLGHQPPHFPEGARAGIRIESSDFAPLEIMFSIASNLAASLEPAPKPARLRGGDAPGNQVSGSNALREPNLDLLLDIELETTLRFGERSMVLRDVLELGPGAIIELDRQIDEPVELLVGNTVIARGEVVVVDGNYGLRVMEMASRQERIDSIRG